MQYKPIKLFIDVVIPFSFLVPTLDCSVRSLNSSELSILKTTLESLVIHCKQTKNLSEVNANESKTIDNYSDIDVSDAQNCCSIKLFDVSVKKSDFCHNKDNEDLIVIYSQLMDSNANETDMRIMSDKSDQKCIKLTENWFCENISNKLIAEYIIDETISRSIDSSCNESDIGIGDEFVKKNVLLIPKIEPFVSEVSTNIIMRSFETEKLELKCIFRAFPRPEIQWFRDNRLISGQTNDNFSELELESVGNELSIKSQFETICTTITTLELPLRSGQMYANYSCNALNIFGLSSNTFLITEKTLKSLKDRMRAKHFNMTGFVIGMIPPMLISFYIILKLGYRSRYAQECPDENGQNEEPFFVSY